MLTRALARSAIRAARQSKCRPSRGFGTTPSRAAEVELTIGKL